MVGTMNLQAVMEEIAEKLKLFTGLNVFDYPLDSVNPPAGILGYPEEVKYDETYGRGEDMFLGLPLFMVTQRMDSKEARNQVSDWTDPHGPKSVKTYLDKENYRSCDSVDVTNATFTVYTSAGIDFLCALFEMNVSGQG
jgi:hypothetical protein